MTKAAGLQHIPQGGQLNVFHVYEQLAEPIAGIGCFFICEKGSKCSGKRFDSGGIAIFSSAQRRSSEGGPAYCAPRTNRRRFRVRA